MSSFSEATLSELMSGVVQLLYIPSQILANATGCCVRAHS